jgi:hypothetical protein
MHPMDHEEDAFDHEEDALPKDVEQAAVKEKKNAQVWSEASASIDEASAYPQASMKLRRLRLEDEADTLASNSTTKDADLSLIDDDAIQNLTLSPVCKAKLRRLVKPMRAQEPEEASAATGYAAETSARVQEGGAGTKVLQISLQLTDL